MNVTWRRTVNPDTEVVAVPDAKDHLRVDHAVDDLLIHGYLAAARAAVEEFLARGLYTQTWKLVQDDWTDVIWLARAAPLQSVSSVKYYDAAGVLATLASSSYTVDADSEPGRIALAPNYSWPALQSSRINRIEVTYVVGWSDVKDIPAPIKQAILLLVGHWYENREAVLVGTSVTEFPLAVGALLAPYRIWWRPPCGAVA